MPCRQSLIGRREDLAAETARALKVEDTGDASVEAGAGDIIQKRFTPDV